MIEISIPGRNMTLYLENILLDLNGTLTTDGKLIKGVKEGVNKLKDKLNVYLLTSDTLGSGAKIAEELDIPFFKVNEDAGGPDKRNFLNSIDAAKTAAIGNGYNDTLMLEYAALSIAVIGDEGCSVRAMLKADIVVININDALELLLNPLRIKATLRA